MFCRVYITGFEGNELLLLNSISEVLGKTVNDNLHIEDKCYSLSVRTNDEYDRKKEKDFPDGFLYFKFLIEIDFSEACDIKYLAESIDHILEFLWKKKYSAVASCKIEEFLIEKGGYNSRNLPWP